MFHVPDALIESALCDLGLVNFIEVSSQANFAGPYLADDGATV